MQRMMFRIFSLVVLAGMAVSAANAQALVTGETGGQGAHAVIVSTNAIYPKDYTVLANNWAQYCYGATNRIDVCAGPGVITAFGRSQAYGTFTANIGVLKRDKAKVDVALFTNVSVPFTCRDKASSVLLYNAVIASRPVKLGRLSFTPYGGFSRLAPIVNHPDAIFTPPEVVHSGIAGVSFQVKKITVFLEWNPGPAQRSGGTGFLYVFPKR